MIYLQLHHPESGAISHMAILEPDELDAIQTGPPAMNIPRSDVIVSYSPDCVWLVREMAKLGDGLSMDAVVELLKEGQKRPKVYNPGPRPGRRIFGPDEAVQQ